MFANMPLFNNKKQQQQQQQQMQQQKSQTVSNGSVGAPQPYSSLTSTFSSFGYENNNHHQQHSAVAKSVSTATNGMETTALSNVTTTTTKHNPALSAQAATIKQQLVFHCQLAHGSPTGLITGFSSVKELYQKIAECYDFPIEEIIFCTLNTHKVDMNRLLGGQIGLDDFIFAHKKGRPKEIEIVKTEDALGLTITDNGAGYAFIKRIKEGSVIYKIPHIMIGDHIEKLNDVSVVGKRHFEVARLLKEIPTGSTFTLRLVEPMKSGFQDIGPRSGAKGAKKQAYGSGKETLRFKANGNAEIENIFDDVTQTGIDAINTLLDSFMGINDSELATQIWDLGVDKTNSMDFAEALDNSDLEAFGFTDDFVIELWGAITDARHGRTKK